MANRPTQSVLAPRPWRLSYSDVGVTRPRLYVRIKCTHNSRPNRVPKTKSEKKKNKKQEKKNNTQWIETMAGSHIQLSHFSLNEKLKVLNHEQIRWFYATMASMPLPPSPPSSSNVFCSLLIKFNCNSSARILWTTQKSHKQKEQNAKFLHSHTKEKEKKKIKRWNRYFVAAEPPPHSTHTRKILMPSVLWHHRVNSQENECCIMNSGFHSLYDVYTCAISCNTAVGEQVQCKLKNRRKCI